MAEDVPPRRIVVFCGPYNDEIVAEHVEALVGAFPSWKFIVLQETNRASPTLKGRLRRWRREPVSYPLQAFAHWRWAPDPRPEQSPIRRASSPRELESIGVTCHSVGSLRSAEAIALVKDLQPDIGVSIAAPILKRELFDIPNMGTYNLHKSLLPAYRGMPPAFWEIHGGATETGVTVHRLDDGLDTGPLIWQERLQIPEYTTPEGLSAELDVFANRVLIQALKLVATGEARAMQQPAGECAPANRAPSFLLSRRVRRRAWRRRRGQPSPVAVASSGASALMHFGYAHLWAPLRNAWRARKGACHATIVLYHRVGDHFVDDITVGVEQFRRQLAIMARHYDVEDMPTFLARRGQPRTKPVIILTFDDGYEDNYLAACLLRRAGLPCTFFVSTGIVGTDNGFPHDLKDLGRPIRALSWDQVRQMTQWGFHIANHTVTHADLGSVDLSKAVQEVAGASQDLTQKLGERESARWLGYPYGKPWNMTEELRRALPGLGVSVCFSAYGGVNAPTFDPLNIMRQGSEACMTDLSFRAMLEGWTGLRRPEAPRTSDLLKPAVAQPGGAPISMMRLN